MEAAVDDAIRNHQGRRGGDGGRREGRVVVGVDGSLASLGALRRAVAEVRRLGRQLCAVCVVRPERLRFGLVSLGLVSVEEGDVAALYQKIDLA
jgi:nucleotide-binding universal stress UspA family protein